MLMQANLTFSVQSTWLPGDALTSDISQSNMSTKDEKAVVEKKE